LTTYLQKFNFLSSKLHFTNPNSHKIISILTSRIQKSEINRDQKREKKLQNLISNSSQNDTNDPTINIFDQSIAKVPQNILAILKHGLKWYRWL
jgi:hypothetical protein